MNELAEKLEELNKEWKEYRRENDKKLELIQGGKSVDTLLTEKLENVNAAMAKNEKAIEDIQTALKRRVESGADMSKEEKEEALSDAMNTLHRTGRVNEKQAALLNESCKKELTIPGECKTLSADINIDGGYFVRPELLNRIEKREYESSPVRQLAEVITTSANSVEFLYDDDQPDVEWLGERQAPTDPTDNNEIRMLRIQTHILSANPRMSQTLLDDANLNVEAWHAQKVLENFARTEATAFCTGSGVGQPRGIAAYTSGTSYNQIQQVASGSSGAFTADGLIDLQNALFERFQPNASWLMARASAGEIRQLKDGQGRYLWSVNDGLIAGMPPVALLGKPVRFANDVAAIAASSLSAYYGDFKAGYMIVDRIGVRVLRDPYSSKPFVSFYTTKRVGGGVKQFQAIKLQVLST